MARDDATSPFLDLSLPVRMPAVYLDNGATSFPKPEEVYRAMDGVHRSRAVNPGRSGFALCLEAGALVDQTRRLLCDHFGGADPDRLVFSHNATDALNLALFGLLSPGDHAVATALEHNATLRPLTHLQDAGVAVDWVDFEADGWVDPERVIARIRPGTKCVVMNHASNVLGTVQDVAPVGRACRERGVHLVLDVSQTAGKVRLKVDELGCDVLCFTGHKGLMGPMGTGGMYVREGVEIRHTRAGGTGVRSQEHRHLVDYPYRMEYGTPNLPGIAGLQAGLRWVESVGLERLHRHEMALWARLRDGLAAAEGVALYCADDAPGKGRIGVLAFNLEGLEAPDVGSLLDVDHAIACRAGFHCAPRVHEHLGTDAVRGAVRLSLGPFNGPGDVDDAVAAVGAIADMVRTRRG